MDGTDAEAEEALSFSGDSRLRVMQVYSACRPGDARKAAAWAMQIEFFFFQAEDGIRDVAVTGVQTCALPIYNLLTVIKGNSDLALERLKSTDAVRGNCEQIRRVADRAAMLTRQLLAFSRRQMLQPKVLDLNELIAEMGRLLQRLLREDIEYKVQLSEPLARVQADPGQIEQVLLNLIVNAADAMPKGGTLTIATEDVCVDPL